MIDRRTGEVWFVTRELYRSFATKSVLPNGPILRMHINSGWGITCSYLPYATYIKRVNRNRRPKADRLSRIKKI